MALEDTIRYNLFGRLAPNEYVSISDNTVAIECKAEAGKPIPLCMVNNALSEFDVAYMRLYCDRHTRLEERTTPRSMYNTIFSHWYSRSPLLRLKVKDTRYYAANGVLFTEDKVPLFYFAHTFDDYGRELPRLYLTPELLVNASMSGKPMEKFFMSTVVPYLVNNSLHMSTGNTAKVIIEMCNNVDDVFFVPGNTLVTTTPVAEINSRLNNILADNSSALSAFFERYGDTA